MGELTLSALIAGSGRMRGNMQSQLSILPVTCKLIHVEYNSSMEGNGNTDGLDADTLAKIMARISANADSEEYKLHVFRETENAYLLNFISQSQRDAIFAILFTGQLRASGRR